MNAALRFAITSLMLAGTAVQAAEPVSRDDIERRRIATERAAVEASYEQRRQECEQRFAVTPCVDEARAARREALGRLRRQESLLDEAQRKQRAAARMATIRDKVSAEETREQAPAPSPRHEPPMRVVAPRAGGHAAAAAASAPTAEQREAVEARNRARFEERQREAAAHREAAEERVARKTKAGKPPVAPLPPASSP